MTITDEEIQQRNDAYDQRLADELRQADHELTDWSLDRIVGQLEQVIPPRYRDAMPTNSDALAWLDATLLGSPDGLLLLGATGRGKTHLAYGLLRQLIAAQCHDRIPRMSITAGSVPTLLAEARPGKVKIKYHLGDPYEYNPLEAYKNCGLLFLDDLGAEKASEWTTETLYQIIDHRYNQMLPVIAASNLPPSELAGAIGDRLASRLTEMCRTVVIKGDDRRRLKVA